MSTILLIVLVILLLGGFGGYHGYSRYGAPGLGGVLGLVLIVIIVLWLVGGVQVWSGHPATVSAGSPATGASADTLAHAAILTISAIPDVLAVVLLVTAGYATPKAPAARAARCNGARQLQPRRFGANP